ncbi:SIR2 family protein [Salinibacterium sp. SWN248]|uniref:SIR2 family protein n=1 Tax=Salinibacterium sp. SWN248 TaxID=2792056 RepID=UPI0018CCABCB|nr:SIR2 family protein [Salinibacterium sp. SWN248]MBH0023982.1 SIR2 family protein [Salinibacterium sp. SWN248]
MAIPDHKQDSTYEPYGAHPRVEKYDIVISGAGISLAAPSNVPTGDDLMRNTWDRLIRGLAEAERAVLEPATSAIHSSPAPIWLEPLAEIVDTRVGERDILVSTYVDVSTQKWNVHHQMLTAMDALQITLNVDTLLEAAGGEAWHLHGRWDDPASIVTTVRQYSDGLPPKVSLALVAALEHRNVLVLGYSGRDTDVIPILMKTSPKLLHWMHFGSAPVDGRVERLQHQLGGVMSIFSGGAQDVLPLFHGTKQPKPAPLPANPRAEDRFDEIPQPRRLLATSAIAFELGLNNVVIETLSSYRFVGQDEIGRRKLLARSHSRLANHSASLRVLAAAPRDIQTFRAWPRTVNEIAAILPAAGHPLLGNAADHLLAKHPRMRDSARVRIAAKMQIDGRLDRSRESLKATCEDPLVHQRIGIPGLVDALTAYSDTLKLLGDYTEALRIARRATAQASYANLSQRAFAIRRLAEIADLSGMETVAAAENELPKAPRVLLRELYEEARAFGDRQVSFWSAACLANTYLRLSNFKTSYWIALAREDIPNHSPISKVYLLLIEAERERHWGSLDASISFAARAQDSARGLKLASLIAQLSLSQTLALTAPSAQPSQDLARLHREFARLGAGSLSARAQLFTLSMRGEEIANLAAGFRINGWNHEADASMQDCDVIMALAWPVIL